MGVQRFLQRDNEEDPARKVAGGDPVPLRDWLEDLEAERDWLIMRLRAVERPLVKYGRLKNETLNRRAR